ncbi:MAG: hypothetical protein E7108_07385 [Bacteroidales bacterium]|nr:hypothetical protein [Bacteroidales bacterium]
MNDLLINFAFDSNNNIVFAKDAIKGIQYKCPECGEELVFKSSGKTGPGSRRPHFAHKGGGGLNCTPESMLHSAFKLKTAEILQGKIASGCKEFIINWKCDECQKSYNGNLLYLANDVKVELDLGVCRPDIALLDSNGKVVFAIEIVNTHYPEEDVLKYYRDNGIVLVQYNVTEVDLQDIEGRLQHPDNVSLCLNSKCPVYNTLYFRRTLRSFPIICRVCNSEGYAYGAECCSLLGHIWYSRILNGDLEILKTNGIDLSRMKIKNLIINNANIEVIADKCNCKPRFVLSFPRPAKKSRRF